MGPISNKFVIHVLTIFKACFFMYYILNCLLNCLLYCLSTNRCNQLCACHAAFTFNYAVQVLELAVSLFIPNFVLDMPMWWVRKCSCCHGWAHGYGDLPEGEDSVYCHRCWKWWYDMHAEVWWPVRRAYIVMLARCSVQDNPSK